MLPDPQTSYDTLALGVRARVFFNKLAAAGIAPRNDDEAHLMLETAGKLRHISESAAVKQAAAEDNPFVQLNNGVDALMAQYGLGQVKAAGFSDADVAYKQAAADLMQDPSIYNAVLSLKAEDAKAVQAQYANWQGRQTA